MKLIIALALLPVIALALPWCSTPSCGVSFEFRQSVEIANLSGLVAVSAPVADNSSYRVVAHGEMQSDVSFNYSFGRIFFNATSGGNYYLYYSNSPKPIVSYVVPVNVARVNASHADAGPYEARDGSVGDSSTYFPQIGGNPQTNYYKSVSSQPLVRVRLQVVMATAFSQSVFGMCGRQFNFYSDPGGVQPAAASREYCVGCEVSVDPSSCVENGSVKAFTWTERYMELYVYDVAFGFDYADVSGTASLGLLEKAPNVSIAMEKYQQAGVLNYTVVNDGAEPTNLMVVDSGLEAPVPGVYEVFFNVSHDGASKTVSSVVVVYGKSERRMLNITSLSSAELSVLSNYSFYSTDDIYVDFPHCGIAFVLPANSTETRACDSRQDVNVTDEGVFIFEPIRTSGEYAVKEVLLTPEADDVVLFSNEAFDVKNGSVEIKKSASVTVANQELGQKNETGYAFNRQINVSSAFVAPLQNVSLECEKGVWKAYSTYILRNGSYEKTSATDAGSSLIVSLASLNESVIISYEPAPPYSPPLSGGGGGGGGGSPQEESNVSVPENVFDGEKAKPAEQGVVVSVFLSGKTVKVIASSSECWSKIDSGSFEAMMSNGSFSSFTYFNVASGGHAVFVKCPAGSANASFEIAEGKPMNAITGLSVAGGNKWVGLAVFCFVACVIAAVFLRKRKTANILSNE